MPKIYRKLIHQMPIRPVKDLHFLLFQLGTTTLLLEGPRERSMLKAVWEKICINVEWDNETSAAERQMFGQILFHAQDETQLELILQRPAQAVDYIWLGQFIKKLPAKHIYALAENLLDSKPRDLQRNCGTY